ncbi:hypothetical protein H0266_12720 [Halobacillus locisalis]|uniref:Uncharacterized protein n=1 Tax=Halobacillus locisalis TaxID=220753 RepID=A0A838CUL1_9BACI|nr:hypothetical protein [Halobacillus locisalis]MBA2175757.1 hypothetical protein [Halobacillus locisalis]
MKQLKKSSVWLAPVIIILIGIGILFMENYAQVTEPPSDGWSRELQVGMTPNVSEPYLSADDSGNWSIAYITEDGVRQHTYDRQFEQISETSFDIPVNQYTQIFLGEDAFIYSDYYALYNGDNSEEITDIQKFYPLADTAYYRKDNVIYHLDPSTLGSEQILTVDSENTEVIIEQKNEETHILTNTIDQTGNHLTFYTVSGNEATEKGAAVFTLTGTEEVQDIQFALDDNSYALLVKTLQKQSMSGKVSNQYYYSEATLGDAPDLQRIQFQDPHGGMALQEISDVEMQWTEQGASILFKAFGSTNTRFREPLQFNIYTATLSSSGPLDVKRLSNTPSSSVEPNWINPNTVLWIDRGNSEEHRVLVSSSNSTIIAEAKQLTMPAFLQSLGKTMGMLSTGMFAVVISLLWFIWPLLFLCVVMFTNSRAMDQDRSWVFYIGALIYIGAAVILNDLMFSSRGMLNAPAYLNFTGSAFIYLLGFALLSYAILKAGLSIRKWSPSIQLTYFIGIHVICITIFFGPYLL